MLGSESCGQVAWVFVCTYLHEFAAAIWVSEALNIIDGVIVPRREGGEGEGISVGHDRPLCWGFSVGVASVSWWERYGVKKWYEEVVVVRWK